MYFAWLASLFPSIRRHHDNLWLRIQSYVRRNIRVKFQEINGKGEQLTCRSLLITSNTVVLRMTYACRSTVIRQWHLGVGINCSCILDNAMLLCCPADITVDTIEFVWVKVAFVRCRHSTAILFNAVFSRTTTQSAFKVSRFSVRSEL